MNVLGLVQLATTGMQAFGVLKEGYAQSSASARNAAIARQQARLIQQSNELEVSKLKRQKTTFLSTQRALVAKSGLSSRSGSPMEVILDSATEFELDIEISKYNSKIDQQRYLSQAEEDDREAKRIKSASKTKAFGTLLDGVSTFETEYGGFGKLFSSGRGR